MIEKLSTATLSKLDGGRIDGGFTKAIERAMADCDNRPGLDKARKVTMEFSITPCAGEKGLLETCNVSCKITETLPPRESKTYNMSARPDGLFFQELAPENVHQTTFGEPEFRAIPGGEPNGKSEGAKDVG